MNEQINLRMPAKLATAARKKAKEQGYGSVQEYIEAAVREKTFGDLTERELGIVLRLVKASRNPENLVDGEALLRKMEQRARNNSGT